MRMIVTVVAGAMALAVAASGHPALAQTAPAAKPVDINAIKDMIAGAVADAQKNGSGAPKETFDYQSDKQVMVELLKSMTARLVHIRVGAKGLDTKEMVPGILVFSKAVKANGGRITYCKASQTEAIPAAILAMVLPELYKGGRELIADEINRSSIAEKAKGYNVYAFVRNDGRTVEYIDFRKEKPGAAHC